MGAARHVAVRLGLAGVALAVLFLAPPASAQSSGTLPCLQTEMDTAGYACTSSNGYFGVTGTRITSWTPTGTWAAADEGYAGPFTLGRAFTYYGTDYTQVWIGTNGWISFVDPSSFGDTYTPVALPNSGAPNGFVAPFWTDLDIGVGYAEGWGSQVVYLSQSGYFYAGWENVVAYGTSCDVEACPNRQSFAVKLNLVEDSLDIAIDRHDLPAGQDVVVGIENAAGTIGRTAYSGEPGFGIPQDTFRFRDTLAPVPSATGACGVSGLNGWCRDGTRNVATTGTDAGSGVDVLTCTRDGLAVTCGSVSVGQGTHTVCVTAEDRSNNTSGPSCVTLKLDNVGPTGSATGTCGTFGSAGWCRDTSRAITTSSTDATSGVDTATRTCTRDSIAVTCGSVVVLEGTHTVCESATDLAGNPGSAGCRTLSLDATPPAECSGAFSGTVGNNGWYRSNGNQALSATDATSGVATTQRSLDSAAYATYSGAFPVSGDGTHTVTCRVTDVAGNTGFLTATNSPIRIDTVVPTATATGTCAVAGNSGWCRDATRSVATDATDATSGISNQTCTRQGDVTACGSIPVGQGTTVVCNVPTDVAGNVGAAACRTMKLDNVPPTSTASGGCTVSGSNGWCQDATVTVTLSATDATSGVSTETCTVDSVTGPCGARTVGQGTHTACDAASDVAGNGGIQSCLTVKVDNVAPAVTATGTCTNQGTNGWCRDTDNSVVTGATDATSGVAAEACTLDGVATGCGAVAFSQGTHTVCESATDVAGNAASAACATMKLDGFAPILTPSVDCASPGLNGWCQASSYTYEILASDATSGIAGQPACARDGPAAPCSGAVTGEGAHTIAASAVDVAGNTADTFLQVGIDTAPPEVALDRPCTTSRTPDWCNTPTRPYTLSASDATSGVWTASCGRDVTVAPCNGTVSGEGFHFVDLGASDYAGWNAYIGGAVGIDLTAPDVTFSAPCALQGNAGWCRDAVVASASAGDPLSGVWSHTCALAGSVPCSGTPVLEGDLTFSWVSEDNAGNVVSASAPVKVDAVAPTVTTTAACNGFTQAGWCRGTVSITGSATDATSGVAPGSLACTVDNATAPCGSTPVSGDGHRYLSATAIDVAGNPAAAAVGFKIDATRPVWTVTDLCGAMMATYCVVPYDLDAFASDATSGVATASCTIAGQPSSCQPRGHAVDGVQTFFAIALDVAGNPHSVSIPLRVDLNPPQPFITTNCSLMGDNGWCRGSTTVTAGATDAGSGIPAGGRVCRLDNVIRPCGTFTVTGDGPHVVEVVATDKVGRTASAQATFKIDTTAPEVVLDLPRASAGVYRVFFTASDATSGVTGILLDELTPGDLQATLRTVDPLLALPSSCTPSGTGELVFGSCLRDPEPGLWCYAATVRDEAGNTYAGATPEELLEAISARPGEVPCIVRLTPEPFSSIQNDPGTSPPQDASNDEQAPTPLLVGESSGWVQGGGAIWDTVDAYSVVVEEPGTQFLAVVDPLDEFDGYILVIAPDGTRYHDDGNGLGGAEQVVVPAAQAGVWTVVAGMVDDPRVVLPSLTSLTGHTPLPPAPELPAALRTYEFRLECDPACS